MEKLKTYFGIVDEKFKSLVQNTNINIIDIIWKIVLFPGLKISSWIFDEKSIQHNDSSNVSALFWFIIALIFMIF
jgi:hypothetical protein